MRLPHPLLGTVYLPFVAISGVVVACGPAGEGRDVVGEKADTLLAGAADCRPTRGAVGRRPTSYTTPSLNYLYVSKQLGAADPAHCLWGGDTNPFLTLKRAIECAPANTVTTIVVKSGDYEEGELRVPADKTIRLQRKGTEVVTFWGSRLVPAAEWTSVPNPPAPLRPHWRKTIPSGDAAYTLFNRPWSPSSTCADGGGRSRPTAA